MPRKTKAATTATKNNNPTQSELARLISDSFDVFQSELMSSLIEANTESDSLNLSRDNLVTIQATVRKNAQQAKDKTINNLLTYYS